MSFIFLRELSGIQKSLVEFSEQMFQRDASDGDAHVAHSRSRWPESVSGNTDAQACSFCKCGRCNILASEYRMKNSAKVVRHCFVIASLTVKEGICEVQL